MTTRTRATTHGGSAAASSARRAGVQSRRVTVPGTGGGWRSRRRSRSRPGRAGTVARPGLGQQVLDLGALGLEGDVLRAPGQPDGVALGLGQDGVDEGLGVRGGVPLGVVDPVHELGRVEVGIGHLGEVTVEGPAPGRPELVRAVDDDVPGLPPLLDDRRQLVHLRALVGDHVDDAERRGGEEGEQGEGEGEGPGETMEAPGRAEHHEGGDHGQVAGREAGVGQVAGGHGDGEGEGRDQAARGGRRAGCADPARWWIGPGRGRTGPGRGAGPAPSRRGSARRCRLPRGRRRAGPAPSSDARARPTASPCCGPARGSWAATAGRGGRRQPPRR